MDYVSWRDSLAKDADVLELLTLLVGDITPEHDLKLQELFRVIDNKITHPINEGNKKLIIFTAFADTAGYLYDNVSRYIKDIGLNAQIPFKPCGSFVMYAANTVALTIRFGRSPRMCDCQNRIVEEVLENEYD